MEHNQLCAQYCIAVIQAVMREQEIPPMPAGVSLAELYQFSRMHSLEALVCNGISQLDQQETDPVWRHWSERAQMILTQSVVQLGERDALFNVLTEAGMEILPVKGSWLKEEYPQIDFRQMADLDILIHREDRMLSQTIMRKLGYTENTEDSEPYHDSYDKKPYMAVELHSQLLPSSDPNCAYYENVWDKAKPVDGNPGLRRLSAEDAYIYYFLHLKKHMEEAGCGIRYLLDCFVYRNANPDWDREYLLREFRKLGVYDFVQKVEQISDCWFRTGADIPDSLTQMAQRILWTGSYGSVDNLVQNRFDELKRKYKHPVIVQIVYWSSRFFRPLDEMVCKYPILRKMPFLLPVFWIVRIVDKVIRKPRELLRHVKHILKGGSDNG